MWFFVLFFFFFQAEDGIRDLTVTGVQTCALPISAAGRLSVKIGERKIEVVVRRFHSAGGTSLLLKIIERSDFLRALADLGPSALDLERIRQALALPSGLVVLSAPPHNGLETTRYSLMAHVGS